MTHMHNLNLDGFSIHVHKYHPLKHIFCQPTHIFMEPL